MGRDRAARPGAKPVRLFVAIEVPEAARQLVDAAFGPWREAFPQARWVPVENWHVTMKFLGQTWPRLLSWVPEQLRVAALDVEPFPTRAVGVGSFPSLGRGRVLWAGLDDADGQLGRLAATIDAALLDEFPVEQRPFHPHLTVARSEPPVRLPPEYAETALLTEPWEIEHVVLFRSHLQRPAPRYEPLASFPLGRP